MSNNENMQQRRKDFYCVSRKPFADEALKKTFNSPSGTRVTVINRATYGRALEAATKKLRGLGY